MQTDARHVDAVDADLPVCGFNQSQEREDDRRLASSCSTYGQVAASFQHLQLQREIESRGRESRSELLIRGLLQEIHVEAKGSVEEEQQAVRQDTGKELRDRRM